MEHSYKIVATPTFLESAKAVHAYLQRKYGFTTAIADLHVEEFPNGENDIRIESNVRDDDIYFFHSMQLPNPDKALMTALFTLDALKQADAKSITLVLPYMSYLRQDRREDGRTPISGEVACRLLTADSLVRRVVTIDMHCHQAEGFFTKPVDHIPGIVFFKQYIQDIFCDDFRKVEIVSPDYGSAKRVEKFAKSLDPSLNANVFGKRRSRDTTETMHYVGEPLDGKHVILYDDQVDTGGTILGAAKRAKELGAREVLVVAPHGLFTTKKGSAQTCEEKFAASGVKVITTNTIPRSAQYYADNASWLTVLPIEEKVGEIIRALSMPNGSVSEKVKGWLK